MNILKRIPTLMPAIALAAVFSLLGSATAYAQKKPGGGGDTTTVPAGTIHFLQSTTEPWYYANMTMKADGSAKTQIGISEQWQTWEPSYQLHGGQRWFLTSRDTEPMDDYGWWMKQELFAHTAAGDLVQLTTDDPDLWFDGIHWAKDDSFLSFVGYRYDAITDEEEEDLYVADVDWSSGSPEIGAPRKVLSTQYWVGDLSDGYKDYYFGAYDWSPDGNELVYNDVRDWDRQEIRVIEFFADGTTRNRLLGRGFYPTWSPAGRRIAFTGTEGAIWLIGADGDNSLKITSSTFDRTHWDAHWSPDGKYIAYTEQIRKQKGFQQPTYTNDVLRVSVADGKVTNLTTDTDANCWSIGWR
jgi:hypothetical protein